MEYGIYTVYVDYGYGGHHEIVAAFEDKPDAVKYAKGLLDEVLKGDEQFLAIDDTHDGYFLFRRETITGIRVVPDFGMRDDDDDDEDEGPNVEPDGSPSGRYRPEPITHEEFEQMMSHTPAT